MLNNFWAFGTILCAFSTSSVAQIPVSEVVRCELLRGEDAGAKLSACFAALPMTGGTADARGLMGEQRITRDIFADITKPGKLLLGDATYTLSEEGCFNVPSGWRIEGTPKSVIRGSGGCREARGRIVLTTGSGVLFRGFKVQGAGTVGEQCLAVMNGASDVVIDGTQEDNCGQYGIMVASNEKSPAGGFNNIQILNNKITNLGADRGSNIGIEVFPRFGEAERRGEGYLVKGLLIHGNSITAKPGAEIGCGIKMSGTDHGAIKSNVVDMRGVQFSSITAGGICVVLSERPIISNNKILGGKNGIAVSGLIDSRNPYRNRNVVVRENIVSGQVLNGIYSAEGQDGLVIERNVLDTDLLGSRGIWLQKRSQSYEQIVITDNTISSYSIAVDVDASAARVKPNIFNNKISGKIVIK